MVTKKAKTRRSAEETREILIAAGLRQLQHQGLQVGLDSITLEGACSEAGVPRSSSHSAWAIDDAYAPQSLFQRSVLKAWLSDREATMFADAAQTALLAAFEERGDSITKGEIIRAAIQAAFDQGYNFGLSHEEVGGAYLSTDLAIRYAIASQPEAERDPEIVAWLREGELANRADRVEDSYKPLGVLLNMRPKAEYGERAYVLFGIAIAALVEGIGLRTAILPELELDQPLYAVPDGHVEAKLIGVCVEGLADTFFEPIPDSEISGSEISGN